MRRSSPYAFGQEQRVSFEHHARVTRSRSLSPQARRAGFPLWQTKARPQEQPARGRRQPEPAKFFGCAKPWGLIHDLLFLTSSRSTKKKSDQSNDLRRFLQTFQIEVFPGNVADFGL